MKTKSIKVLYSRTQSLGNFSNVKVEVEQTVDVDEKEDPKEVRSQLLKSLRFAVNKEIDQTPLQDEKKR